MHAESLQSCLTFCDPVDLSLPVPSVHGILRQYWSEKKKKKRILEWVVMLSPRVSSRPKMEAASPATPALEADSLLLTHCGSQ